MLSAKYFFHLVYHSHVTVPGQAFLLFSIVFPGHGTLRSLDGTNFLMWTSSGSWVGSYGPTPEAGYKLIGTTIPALNMSVYSPKNVNYFIVKKNPRNLLRALAERITHPLLSSSVHRLECHFLLFIRPFVCLFMALFFLEFWNHKSWAKLNKVWRMPIYSLPCPLPASPTINISQHSGTFVTVNEPILTYHYQSKPMVYIRIHSWCHNFYDFWQMYKDMYSPLWYCTE